MNVGVGALNTIYLNTIFPTPSDPGQVVRVVVEEPGALLNLSVLSSFSIQPFNRDAAVGPPIAADGALISARLLSGYAFTVASTGILGEIQPVTLSTASI